MNKGYVSMRAKIAHLRPNQLLIPVAIFLLVIVVGQWAYGWWDEKISDYNDRIELRELQLNKYARISKNSDNYSAVNRALLNLQDDVQKQRLFHAGTEALAQAKFQNMVKGLAKKNRIDIRSTKIITAHRQDDFTLLRLRIDAKAEIGAIRDFLLDLRTEDHYIFVSDLEIRTINSREVRYYYLTAELVAMQDVI